jgi:predicted NBD/HSP70 family sugar kinase
MILAGDIGGTKTNLALYDWTTERVEPVREDSFHSADYKTLEEIIEEFLSAPLPKPPSRRRAGRRARRSVGRRNYGGTGASPRAHQINGGVLRRGRAGDR